MKNSHRGQTRRKRRGGLAVAGLCWLAAGCGTDPAVPLTTGQPPPVIVPQPAVDLDQRSYVLAPGQSMTAQARVTGGSNLTVEWVVNCETGQVTLTSSGNSAVLTAQSSGTCFLWAIVGQAEAEALVKVPPLPLGDGCASDLECSPDAPLCRRNHGPCAATCTRRCTTSSDCGGKACNAAGLCQVVTDPDAWCP
jgi:hypothetical protein